MKVNKYQNIKFKKSPEIVYVFETIFWKSTSWTWGVTQMTTTNTR